MYRLTFFNEKVVELNDSSFIKNWKSQKILWDSLTSDEPWDNLFPNEDEIKAFILSWRFIYQEQDNISIQKLTDVYDSKFVDIKHNNEFQNLRMMLNTYLDLNFRSSKITNRQILKAFIYGRYAHSSEKEKNLYLELIKSESKLRSNYASFYSILNNYLRTANQIKDLNDKILHELSET